MDDDLEARLIASSALWEAWQIKIGMQQLLTPGEEPEPITFAEAAMIAAKDPEIIALIDQLSRELPD